MKISRTWIISAVFILVAVAVGVWLYPRLPAQVATHFDAQGRANGWSPRWLAAWLPAMMVAGAAILTWLLPAISPRNFAITSFARVYTLLMLVIQAIALVIGVCLLLKGAGFDLPMTLIGLLAAGVMMLVLGNYMGKLRKNFFIGIRTPWTLASDAVWERTHRLGGWTFMAGGVVLIIGALAGRWTWWVIAAVAIAALVPAVYSFVIYRRLEGRHAPEGEDS